MVDFVVCPSCGLQHRARADGSCPRCVARGSGGSASPGAPRAESFEDSASGRRLRVILIGIIVLAVTGVIFAVLSVISPPPSGSTRGYGKFLIMMGLALVGIWSWGKKVLSE
jgi:hypothetical protein